MRAPFDGIGLKGVYGRSWKQFGIDLWKEISEDNVFNGAAAVVSTKNEGLFSIGARLLAAHAHNARIIQRGIPIASRIS